MIVLIGLVVGVGVLLFDKFSTVSSIETFVVQTTDEITALNNTNVSLTGYDIIADPTNISHINGTDLTNFVGNWTVNNGSDGVLATFQLRNETWDAVNLNITYTYNKKTPTYFVLKNMTAGLAPIGSSWMPLIITISILAIILTMVMSAFVMKR